MSLKITRTGLLDTVQDLGRWGYQHQGINPGGAMDRFAASLANALLGNKLQAPVLELHFPAAQICFQQAAIICLAGADFTPCVNGEVVPVHTPIAIQKASVLSFTKKRNGARCYLAVRNELHLEPWLNSYSTNLKAAAGGYKGRRLQKEDEIFFEPISFQTERSFALLPWKYNVADKNRTAVEVLPGPEWHWLSPQSQAAFLHNAFIVTPASDRMGYRLQGQALVQKRSEQLVSSAVTFGTVQLLPNGQLIVLMADHQTTGGYPRVATVSSTHLPQLAQKDAGDSVQFLLTTIETAEEKFLLQQNYLSDLQNTCKLKIENWFHAHRS
jgi:antagonist of KipI